MQRLVPGAACRGTGVATPPPTLVRPPGRWSRRRCRSAPGSFPARRGCRPAAELASARPACPPTLLAAIIALAAAPAVLAQTWEFELDNRALTPARPSTTVIASIDPGPGADAVAGANIGVHATEEGWSDLVALLSLRTPRMPGQNPGEISGASVIGISVGQLITGFMPTPGRIEVWQATLTVTDFAPRQIDLTTATTRLDVYLDLSVLPVPMRETRTPIEGRTMIQVVPAPAGLALLGLGGVVFAGRRRSAVSACRGNSR
jgi:hypothetical protein